MTNPWANLRTLYLRDLGLGGDSESEGSEPEDSAKIGLLDCIQSRSRVPDVPPLQHLCVSISFVKESEIEGLRGCVDMLTLLVD